MRFLIIIEVKDVKEVCRIVKESLLMRAIDPSTEKVDMDMIITGRCISNSRLLENLKDATLLMVNNRTAIIDVNIYILNCVVISQVRLDSSSNLFITSLLEKSTNFLFPN